MIAVFTLGFGKGIFNVGMARLIVKAARVDISGMIMGLWAVVGGIAIGIGEFSGAALVDVATKATDSAAMGYGFLFIIEGFGLLLCLFLIKNFKMKHYHDDLEEKFPLGMGPEWV